MLPGSERNQDSKKKVMMTRTITRFQIPGDEVVFKFSSLIRWKFIQRIRRRAVSVFEFGIHALARSGSHKGKCLHISP